MTTLVVIRINTSNYNNSYYARGFANGTAEALNSSKVTYTYHKHDSNCYSVCDGTVNYLRQGATGTVVMICNKCGQYHYRKTEESQPFTCNITSIICGKTEDTIETAIISFE